MNRLKFAAQVGDLESTLNLINSGFDINMREKDGRTPLHYSADNNHVDIVKALIAAGADVDAREEDGWTPLLYSAKSGHVDVAKTFIDAGADVNARNEAGWTSLHFSANFGRTDIVKALISAGADIDAVDAHGGTPLHCSAMFCNVDVMKALIASGADVNAKKKRKWTPLHLIAKNGFASNCYAKRCVKALIAAGADDSIYAIDLVPPYRNEVREALIKYTLLYQDRSLLEPVDSVLYHIWKECEKQIKKMKETLLGGSCVTFFSYMTETDINKLALYSFEENFGIKNYLERISYRKMFSMYAEDIEANFNEGSERAILLHKTEKCMIRCFCYKLPPEIIRKICMCLTNDAMNFLLLNDI